MTSLAHSEPAWNVVPIGTDLRNEMLDGAVRERAIRIQESRLQGQRHEPTPTQAARVETLWHLDCGILSSEDEIKLTTDVGCFHEGDVAFVPNRDDSHCADRDLVDWEATHMI